MSSFTEWAVKYGKLQRGTAATYWSGLKNTKFKSDDIPLTDIDNIEDYIFRTGKHNVEKSDIKNSSILLIIAMILIFYLLFKNMSST